MERLSGLDASFLYIESLTQPLHVCSILELDTIPKKLIVLGAGAVGTEFASIFNHVGSEVTLIEYMPNVLPIEDIDISKELEKQLKRRKMNVMPSARSLPV